MITFQEPEIYLQFNEKEGSIHSLVHGGREYVGEETPVFKIAIRDTQGESALIEMKEMHLRNCEEKEKIFHCSLCGIRHGSNCFGGNCRSHRMEDCH